MPCQTTNDLLHHFSMSTPPTKRRRRIPKALMAFTSNVPWRGRKDDEPMQVGYVRVSTTDQTTQRQVDELVQAGVSAIDIFGDEASGATMERPGWEACGRELREGDILVIHSLDRLSRNLVDTMTTLQALNDRGVTVRVLTMDFDSRTPIGRFVFSMMAGFAQFERDIILERTVHGLARAKARGRYGGASQKFSDGSIASAYARAGTVTGAAKLLKCSEPTIKRGLARIKAAKEIKDADPA